VHFGLDNDNASNPLIQPPGVSRPQHMNDTDLLFGRESGDLLVGNKGNDVLLGGPGPDVLVGGIDRGGDSGNDVMVGDDGDDVEIWSPGDGNDIADGNDGTDTLIVGPVRTTYGGGLRLDTVSLNRTIPRVDIDGFPAYGCTLIPVPASAQLGQYLLRFTIDGTVMNTLRVKDTERVICPGDTDRTAQVADLTAARPSFTSMDTSSVPGLAGAIIAPLRDRS
jgi:Ca2+-binding RTX toxin-like protein